MDDNANNQIRIGVIYKKNNSNCSIGNTEIVMFLSQRLTTIAFSQVSGHSVHFFSTYAFGPAWLESSCFIFYLLPHIVRPFSGDAVILCA